MNENNGTEKGHVGTVMMRLMYTPSCIGDGEALTEWEQGILKSIRDLCRSGIDRPDVVREGPPRRSIGAVWYMSPAVEDLQNPDDRRVVDGMDAIWATQFEQGLLDDIRRMALEALGRAG